MPTILLIALSSCAALAQGVLQNPALTPGAVLTGNKAAVCWPGYSKTVRDVREKTKRAVLASYGVNCAKRDCGKLYEIDHLVSLDCARGVISPPMYGAAYIPSRAVLGGSNDLKNLWPEPSGSPRERPARGRAACRRLRRKNLTR